MLYVALSIGASGKAHHPSPVSIALELLNPPFVEAALKHDSALVPAAPCDRGEQARLAEAHQQSFTRARQVLALQPRSNFRDVWNRYRVRPANAHRRRSEDDCLSLRAPLASRNVYSPAKHCHLLYAAPHQKLVGSKVQRWTIVLLHNETQFRPLDCPPSYARQLPVVRC